MSESNKNMTFLQHLESLRWHFIRSIIVLITASIYTFINKSLVFDTILFAPKKSDFITFKWLCKASYFLNKHIVQLFPNKELLCLGMEYPKLQNISMSGQFTTHITASIVAGFVIAFPYIFWEFWRFLKPALKKEELKYSRGLIFWAWILFISGILFAYFIVVPLSVNFFFGYNISEEVQSIPTLNTYINTVLTIILSSGMVFELPILIYFLTKLGFISPRIMKKFRKHSFVLAIILSAIITPPDMFSQILVCIPIIILYEISILVSKIVLKKNMKSLV